MSTQQLAEILKISARNPPPANATPAVMRDWAEGITSQAPLAGDVTIRRFKLGPYEGDLVMPAGGDASRLVIYYHGGGFLLLFVPPDRQRAVRGRLSKLIHVPFGFDVFGSQVIFADAEREYVHQEQERSQLEIAAFRELGLDGALQAGSTWPS